MYSECSVRRVCLMDLLLAPIPPASVGQQTLILSKMAALANLRLSLKLMHPAAHSHSYQAKCQAGRKKRPNSPLKFSGSGFVQKILVELYLDEVDLTQLNSLNWSLLLHSTGPLPIQLAWLISMSIVLIQLVFWSVWRHNTYSKM